MTIAVINYGIGNIQSVVNACKRVGGSPLVVTDGSELAGESFSHIILPGVGAVGHALELIRKKHFEAELNRLVIDEKTPFLGICVGMQMLGEVCEEFGIHKGFGWIPGRVRKLEVTGAGLRLPHIGWNTVEPTDPEEPLLKEVGGEDVYFVHSYVLDCDAEYILGRTQYGEDFASSVKNGHIFGVQFHPEKSARIGEAVIRAFVEL